ncbi:TCR/Tet family MFS transporter [Paludibacter sp.]|uniref:TCR/Tet family MFS transporter n=1 Tax=Paludibacter sp. TaxID=1898105 RepID=UPI0013521EE9|nr:TCR/Tet family MFS transporter [Paludibacter sp.]MTK53741.1 TCR/Tet family MFS transporter [Paludibacter sp.]
MSDNRKPALGFIFITLLLDVIGFGIIIPVIPKYISHLIGSDLSHASIYSGWLMFSFSVMQFLFSPVIGSLSDRFGRRPVLLIALFGFGLNYLIIAFAPSIGWLFLGRILAGITGASFSTATAYVADISTPEKRAQNFGLIGAAFGLGFIIGPVLGGVLGQYSLQLPFLVAAGLTFLNWIYGYFVLPESLPKENRRKFDIRRANPIGSLMLLRKYPIVSGMVGSLICVMVASFATQSTWTYFTMEAFHWNESLVGYSLGLIGLLMAIVQGGLVRIVNPKLGPVKSIYIGLAFYGLGFLLIAFVPQGWMLFPLMIPFSLGGIADPAAQSIISNEVPSNEQGELQGALTSLRSVTSIVGPVLMTTLFAHFTAKGTSVYFPGAPFVMASLLVVLSILLARNTLSTIRVRNRNDK